MVTCIKAMLEQTVSTWETLGHPAVMERFVLRNGTVFKGNPLPRPFKQGRVKECYSNSASAALRNSRLTYYEGFGVSDDLPIAMSHAWCMLGNKVIDLTWRRPTTRHYMGVPVSLEVLTQELLRNGVYGILDLGYHINTRFMFSVDPALEEIVMNVRATGSTVAL